MSENNLVIVKTENGDWEGIYVNGTLFTEGHSLSTDDYCDLISMYKTFNPDIKRIEVTMEQMEEFAGYFPNDYKELEKILS